jgi:hypothetical protein
MDAEKTTFCRKGNRGARMIDHADDYWQNRQNGWEWGQNKTKVFLIQA